MKINAKNERIKRQYFERLKEASQKSEATVTNVRKSLLRYESYTKFQDFSTFNKQKAIAFKKYLASANAEQTGKPLSVSTLYSTMNHLKEFFKWLAYQPGYKSRIDLYDTDYFNLSEKDVRAAQSFGYKEYPTVEQIKKVIFAMPTQTEIEKRNQALIAFTILTGIRDGAIASLKLKHVNLEKELVMQDPREVKTKASKRIDTYFFPVGDDIKKIVVDWIEYLIKDKLFCLNDPLFPRTKLSHDENSAFIASGITPVAWTSASQIRQIFKESFMAAGLKYYSPHRFRDTLAALGEKQCKTPEQLKAWSQNFGHSNVMTTIKSYGYMDVHKQGEVMGKIGKDSAIPDDKLQLIREIVGL
jgi:integrase/recombinase XerD